MSVEPANNEEDAPIEDGYIVVPNGRVWAILRDLECLVSWSDTANLWAFDNDPATPAVWQMSRRITGTATPLRCKIRVLGREAPPARSIRMTISEQLSDPATSSAALGFTTGDWELGTEDEWWCELVVPHPVFETVWNELRSGRCNAVTTTSVLNFLADRMEQSFALPREDRNWFLANSKFGGKPARGVVGSLAPHNDDPKGSAPDDATEAVSVPAVPTPPTATLTLTPQLHNALLQTAAIARWTLPLIALTLIAAMFF